MAPHEPSPPSSPLSSGNTESLQCVKTDTSSYLPGVSAEPMAIVGFGRKYPRFAISSVEATPMDPQQWKLLEVVFESFDSARVPLSYVIRRICNGIVPRDQEQRFRAISLVILSTFRAQENGEYDAAAVAGANLVQSPEQHLGTIKLVFLPEHQPAIPSLTKRTDTAELTALEVSTSRDSAMLFVTVTLFVLSSEGLPSTRTVGLDFSQTVYIECHGICTPVGDSIEVEALSRVFNDPGRHTLLVGSVKSNPGHGEAASGILSVVKTVLALEHARISATLGVREIG
ncbi:beta-ketoacyl synthase [Usnea florida]